MASSVKNTVSPSTPANRVFKPKQNVVVTATVLASDAATETTLNAIQISIADQTSVATATQANVSASASSVQLLASSPNDVERSVFNDSTATLYLKYGTSASTTSFKVKMGPGDYFEFPRPIYTGVVHGIWDSATGSARVESG